MVNESLSIPKAVSAALFAVVKEQRWFIARGYVLCQGCFVISGKVLLDLKYVDFTEEVNEINSFNYSSYRTTCISSAARPGVWGLALMKEWPTDAPLALRGPLPWRPWLAALEEPLLPVMFCWQIIVLPPSPPIWGCEGEALQLRSGREC